MKPIERYVKRIVFGFQLNILQFIYVICYRNILRDVTSKIAIDRIFHSPQWNRLAYELGILSIYRTIRFSSRRPRCRRTRLLYDPRTNTWAEKSELATEPTLTPTETVLVVSNSVDPIKLLPLIFVKGIISYTDTFSAIGELIGTDNFFLHQAANVRCQCSVSVLNQLSNVIYELSSIHNTITKVKELYKLKSIGQILNYQEYGHIRAYCGYLARCVGCSAFHPFSESTFYF